MLQVQIMGLNPVTNVREPIKITADGEILVSGNKAFLVETLTVVTQNVIPALANSPDTGALHIIAAGTNTEPGVEWTITGNVVTWDEVEAGYNLEIGDTLIAVYMYST